MEVKFKITFLDGTSTVHVANFTSATSVLHVMNSLADEKSTGILFGFAWYNKTALRSVEVLRDEE